MLELSFSKTRLPHILCRPGGSKDVDSIYRVHFSNVSPFFLTLDSRKNQPFFDGNNPRIPSLTPLISAPSLLFASPDDTASIRKRAHGNCVITPVTPDGIPLLLVRSLFRKPLPLPKGYVFYCDTVLCVLHNGIVETGSSPLGISAVPSLSIIVVPRDTYSSWSGSSKAHYVFMLTSNIRILQEIKV